MSLTLLHILLSLLVDNSVQMLSPSVGHSCASEEVYVQTEDLCCRTCSPGYGVALPCTGPLQNNTQCEQCVPGKTYSGVNNHVDHCRPCSPCPPDFNVVSLCNATHNTKCECRTGFFAQQTNHHLPTSCNKCHVCPRGTRIGKMCKPWSDTLCLPCSEGTYSSSPDWTQCRPCSQCPNGQTHQTCNNTSDTICSNHISNGSGSHSSGVDYIPIYCSFLGCIILGLIIYVILKKCKFGSPTKQSSKSQPIQGNCVTAVQNSRLCASPVVKQSSKEKDALLSGEWKLADCDLLQLESELLQRPGSPTHNTNSDVWISLAKYLDYKDLENIGGESSPLRVVLRRWNEDSASTLAHLLHALRAVGRADLLPQCDPLFV